MHDPDRVAATLPARVREPLRSGPILIAYDGTPASEYALREARALLSGERALVVTIWKQGLAFELMERPTVTGLPPARLDISTALENDRRLYEGARRTAAHGAAIAREAGFEAAGLAVAEDVEVSVAETIRRLAAEHDAMAIVAGIEGRGPTAAVVLGATTRDVIRYAPCPVVVVRWDPRNEPGQDYDQGATP